MSGGLPSATGAARGIGRATAVAFAREGADVMGIDIAGPVSSTLEVAPATPEELAETGRMVEAAGTRRSRGYCLVSSCADRQLLPIVGRDPKGGGINFWT